MSEHKIILKREEDIGLFEISNPPQNYLDQPDFIEIGELKNFVESGIKALVVFGSGRHFSAGADLDSMREQINDANLFQNKLQKGNQLLDYVDELNIPVIAAISGVCFGAGLEIALAADIRVCDEKALFAFPEVNQDLIPGLGGIRRLEELVGVSTSLELTLSGDMINANSALHLKIVDDIVERKKVLEFSILKARILTNNRPLKVINAIMQSINNSKNMTIDEVVKSDTKLFTELALEALNDEKQ